MWMLNCGDSEEDKLWPAVKDLKSNWHVLGVGVEKDDGELGWWISQMMPDLISQRWLTVKILADFLERE